MIDVKLAIQGVSKSFGSVTALRETSLSVRAGEFLALLGPSGSGKTTLLMMVAGLLKPDTGAILINGTDATFAPPYERDIGMIFQSYALFPHLSVFENIAFPLRMRRMDAADIRHEVMRALEMVQLAHVVERLPKQLSGGQQQRIALARAVVYRPSIVLMDEPLGALDKKLRDNLQLEIRRLHHELGMTILYVTHDQHEAMTMSDRICLMNHGCIEQLARPEELYRRPATVFAADFLGEANLIDARILSRERDHVSLEVPGFDRPISATAAPSDESDACTIMVRPEAVRLGGPLDANGAPAVVLDAIFAGNLTTVTMRIGEGGPIMSAKLLGSGMALHRGDRVSISWDLDSTVVLPARRVEVNP